MLPMIELTYKRVKQSVVVINYSLVMEIQLVLSFSATVMCTVGMLASGDYKVINASTIPFILSDYLIIFFFYT